jgi:hypothetical protein
MTHEPPKGQENKITNVEIIPHEDVKNTRPDVLMPVQEGAVLGKLEESVLPPEEGSPEA